MSIELQVVLAFLLDTLLGDPQWFPHPVRLIGRVAGTLERVLRQLIRKEGIAGLFAVLLTICFSVGTAAIAIVGLRRVHPWAGDIAGVYLIYSCIALRDLLKHAGNVHRALTTESLPNAREQVAMIVGRDTDELDESGVARATIESVAESFVDGIAAPLFYAIILGPLGAIAYRTINTLDSMFGYRNERYERFGWAAAKLDDLANYLPSRLSTPFLVIAAGLTGHSVPQAIRILKRDHRKHSSPNAGLPESAVAGALQVQLGGPTRYFGRWQDKPPLGDPTRPVESGHIPQVNRIVTAATVLFLVAALLVRMFAIPTTLGP